MATLPRIAALGCALLLSTASPLLAAEPSNPGDVKISLASDRLAFASIADYRAVVDEPSDDTKKKVTLAIKSLGGFTSFLKKQHPSQALKTYDSSLSSLIADDYFASLLNSDLVIQVDKYIFRINPSTQKIYVLQTKYENEYKDLLNENTRNPHIKVFSTEDDVLEQLEEADDSNTRKLICHESGIGSKHDSVQFMSFMVKADFNKYGIFFSLSGSVQPYSGSGFSMEFNFTGGIPASKGHIYYHVRCRSTADYEIVSRGSWHLTNQTYQSYQGSRNLNQVYFFYVLDDKMGNPRTRYVGFRVNK